MQTLMEQRILHTATSGYRGLGDFKSSPQCAFYSQELTVTSFRIQRLASIMPSGGHPDGSGAACGTQKYTAGNASAYIPEAYEGVIPIRLSYEKFLAILQKALDKIGATDIKYLEAITEAQFRTPKMQEGMIGTISITNIYEKRKFLRPYDCLQMLIHTLREPLEFFKWT